MSRVLLCLAAVWMAFGCLGCVQYVEQPTPSGQVAQPVAQPITQPLAQAPAQPYRAESAAVPPPVTPLAEEQAAPEAPGPLFDDSIIGDFAQSYGYQNRPRLAIYFNRSLSDEVREWVTRDRDVLSIQGTYTKTEEDSFVQEDYQGGVSAYSQRHLDSPSRLSPGEGWMWEFEDGFLQPFLEISANVLDRATIMRLAAQQSGRQGSAYDPIAVKKIEMDALTGKADLLIELLVRRNPNVNIGYEFKAVAKEVQTGVIRAMVTSRGWDYSFEPVEKVVADGTGYHFVTETNNALPELNVVSRDLALALMRSLDANWRN